MVSGYFKLIAFVVHFSSIRASRVAQTVKNLPAVQETQAQSRGWDYPLEKGMATHSSILARESNGQRILMGYS